MRCTNEKSVLFLAASLYILFVTPTPVPASTPCAPMKVTQGSLATHADQPQKESLTVASLNMAGEARMGDVLAEWTHDRLLDVLLLQEVGHVSIDGERFVAALSERLGFHFVYAAADLLGDASTQGLAILSRYPLDDARVQPLNYHHLRFKSRCRIALSATLHTTDGPVRLVNVHLDTRINTKDRVAQLAPVLDGLSAVDGPQIIGGDFNTMDIRWFRTMWPLLYFQRQSSAVRGLLGSVGFHTPFTGGPATFRSFGIPFKLDWLYLKHLTPLDWSVDSVRFTDHRGVWARVRR